MLEKDFDDDENNNEDKKRPPRRDETWATTRELHDDCESYISIFFFVFFAFARFFFVNCGFWCTEASFANGAAELCFRLLCNIKCTNINLIHVHLHTSKSI